MTATNVSTTTRWGRLSIALLVVVATSVIGLVGSPAYAETGDGTDGAIAAFAEGDHVYVDPAAGITVDAGALSEKIGDDEVYIAFLPPNQPVDDALTTISQSLSKSATYAVFSGTQFAADSTELCEGLASDYLADRAKDGATASDATAAVSSWLDDVKGGPTENCAESGGSADSDAGSVIPWVIALLVLALGAGGIFVARKRRQKADQIRDLRAEGTALYDRLGSEVQFIDAGDSLIARQAVADAADRYSVAGSILATADTDGEFDAARRACIEGLHAAGVARQEMGLEDGEPIPRLDSGGNEQLRAEQDIQVGDQVYRGYPHYVPGAPLYYAGAQGVPGGWYSVPFWETVLIGSMFSGTWSASADEDDQDDDYQDDRRD